MASSAGGRARRGSGRQCEAIHLAICVVDRGRRRRPRWSSGRVVHALDGTPAASLTSGTDEGEYWETGDPARLQARLDLINVALGVLDRALNGRSGRRGSSVKAS